MGTAHPGPGHDLIQELKHEIFSPLAAIRSALILVGVRSADPVVQRYLELADIQLKEIAHSLLRPRP